MIECNPHEAHNIYRNLNNQQKFILNKINEIKDCFVAEIKEQELMSKRLNYIASFDYFDKSLIFLYVITGGISIASFSTVTGAPVGILNASFGLEFSLFRGTVKKLLKMTRNKKKKHNKIDILARSKLNSIESELYKAFNVVK